MNYLQTWAGQLASSKLGIINNTSYISGKLYRSNEKMFYILKIPIQNHEERTDRFYYINI